MQHEPMRSACRQPARLRLIGPRTVPCTALLLRLTPGHRFVTYLYGKFAIRGPSN